MATLTPDPTFYPSPRLATQAPAEKHAYVADFDPERETGEVFALIEALLEGTIVIPAAAGQEPKQ